MLTPETTRLRAAARHACNCLVHAAALYAQHYTEAFHPITAAAPTVLERLDDGKLHRVQVRVPSTDPARSAPPPAGDLELRNTMRACVAGVSGCLATLGDYHRPRIPGTDQLGHWTPSPDPAIRWTPHRPAPLARVDVVTPTQLTDAVRVAHGLLTLAETTDIPWEPAQRRLIHRACRWARLTLDVWDTPPATPAQQGPWGDDQLRDRARNTAKHEHGTYITPPGTWPGQGPRCRRCGYREVRAKGLCNPCLEQQRRPRTHKATPPPRCSTCGQHDVWALGECSTCMAERRRAGRRSA